MLARRRWNLVAVALGLVASLVISLGAYAQAQSVTLQLASQNNSGVTGTATIADIGGGKLKIDITATGAGTGPQPAHIHEGTCSQLNPAPQFSLTDVRNGSSSTTVDGSLQSLLATPHAIHMHKSPDELAVYVACADIRAATSAGPAGQPNVLPSAGTAGAASGLIVASAGFGLTLIGAGLGLIRRRKQASGR
jgi:Cu/Zn superoxide dismutase